MVADVRSVEAGDDESVGRNAELGQDVGAGACVSGCGEREPRHIGIVIEQGPELAIIGPEIVTPFADAMRFIDRDQREVHAADQPPERVARRALRSDVEQIERAALQPLGSLLAIRVGRRQRRRAEAHRVSASDLVVHQRNQRRDDQRRAIARNCWQLVAERLSRSGRHHRQRVLAGEHAADHLLLDAAEGVKAKSLFEDRVRVGHALFELMRTERAAIGIST